MGLVKPPRQRFAAMLALANDLERQALVPWTVKFKVAEDLGQFCAIVCCHLRRCR
jgi:hypothetical protein